MMPDSVASSDTHVGLWGHLKSIDHALSRISSLGDPKGLTELDRDRLQALVDLLNASLAKNTDLSDTTGEFLVRCWTAEPDYSTAMDFHRLIADDLSFREWKKSSRKPFGEKVGQLTEALESVLDRAQSNEVLISKDPIPQEELKVLRAVLHSILAEIEVALY
jgi:hypothetical protein